jgi:IK cytokine
VCISFIVLQGLDVSLLERNKSMDSVPTIDDEELEKMFTNKVQGSRTTEAHYENSIQKKRTRDEILSELKRKRARPEDSVFPPTESRFKPITNSSSRKQKKEMSKKISKMKTLKPVEIDKHPHPNIDSTDSAVNATQALQEERPGIQVEIEEEPVEDIFAGVGDYDGLGDADDDGSSVSSSDNLNQVRESESTKVNWFNDPEEEEHETVEPKPSMGEQSPQQSGDSLKEVSARTPSLEVHHRERLIPLASSSIKSISEFLEIDKSFEVEEKRKVKREKRKSKNRE